MHVLARLAGRNGEILVLEEPATGLRYYVEGSINQSIATAEGRAKLPYVRLMARLLSTARTVLLFGCGGGVLATELHRKGCAVTVVDNNPIAFQIAREYFWMPVGITCISGDIATFPDDHLRFDAIGIDIGGPDFKYDGYLTQAAAARLRSRLAEGGRIVVNIAVDCATDADPDRTAHRFAAAGLDVHIFEERRPSNDNAVVFARAGELDEAAPVDTDWVSRKPAAGR